MSGIQSTKSPPRPRTGTAQLFVPCGHLLSLPCFCRQCWSDSPQGTADVQRGFPKTRKAPSGLGDAVVQGQGVTAQKQLLLPWLVPISFSLALHLSQAPTATVFFLPFSFQGWAQLSSHRAISTPLLEFSLSPSCSTSCSPGLLPAQGALVPAS